MKIQTMKVIRIETKKIQGITLIDAVFASSTGRVEAKSRLQSVGQVVVGESYSGVLKYDVANNRVFSPKYKVGVA